MQQFLTVEVPRYVAETLLVDQNVSCLSEDSLGALVSLVYNRGSSFRKTDGRYLEMRQIRYLLAKGKYDLIPEQIRLMKRLWKDDPDAKGIVIRREAEAALFERGLAGIKRGDEECE